MCTLRAMPYHTDFSKHINVKACLLFPRFSPPPPSLHITRQAPVAQVASASLHLNPFKQSFSRYEKTPLLAGLIAFRFLSSHLPL